MAGWGVLSPVGGILHPVHDVAPTSYSRTCVNLYRCEVRAFWFNVEIIWTVHTKQAKSETKKGTQENTGSDKPTLNNRASQARTPNRAKRGARTGNGSGRARAPNGEDVSRNRFL